MAEYYLISQLPSLDGISENTPLPITEDRFFELCSGFLGKKAMAELQKAILTPQKDGDSSLSGLLATWYEGERNLRLALAKVRADKMKKAFDMQNAVIPTSVAKVASEAVEIENPKEAEEFLLSYRLSFLESLRPIDNFSDDFITYYAIKLNLLSRMRKFSTELGEKEYGKIYESILKGENYDRK